MSLKPTDFREKDSETFQTEFTTEDGHQINIFITMEGEPLEDGVVRFANEYLSREMQIRQQAATQIFAEHDYIKDELEYATTDDLLKALVPGALTILWQCQKTRMAYLSPLDDLESCGLKFVILASYDRSDDKLEISLEQDGW